jgi:general secretion pathway protein D
VNIILNLGDDEAGERKISFTARYVSLLDAVKIIADISDLRYRIERNMVVIVPKNAPMGTIHTRFYPVDATKMRAISSGGGGDGGGGGDPFGGGSVGGGSALDAGTADLAEYFRTTGVPFPDGSSISYSPAIGQLIVANTEPNLAVFEKVLAELTTPRPQVEIETRFVDIAQSDFEEVGVELGLLDQWEMLQKKGSSGAMGNKPRVVMPVDAAGGFTKGFRLGGLPSNQRSGEIATGMRRGTSILAFQSVLTNPELELLVHAIEQKGRADLLSAPKVLTQPGMEASVRVVTEYMYPTEYTVQESTRSVLRDAAGNIMASPGMVMPENFETREVGVSLQVLPEVSPDNKMITLTLSPEVVTPPTLHDYGYELGDGTRVKMEMPFFHSRTVTTSIKVYDGATVVMGGFISEELKTMKDRIPVLGSIPIIGRLFRSTQQKTEKRNLLIFVTARLIDPSGQPFLTVKKHGVQGMTAPLAPN